MLKQLGEVTPEGACDLAAALDRLTTPLFDLEKGARVHVYLLSEGEILLGESNPARLATSFRTRCPYPGAVHLPVQTAGRRRPGPVQGSASTDPK